MVNTGATGEQLGDATEKRSPLRPLESLLEPRSDAAVGYDESVRRVVGRVILGSRVPRFVYAPLTPNVVLASLTMTRPNEDPDGAPTLAASEATRRLLQALLLVRDICEKTRCAAE